jgi:hypothetical protein
MVPPLLAIFAWPLVGIALFRKLTIQQAVIWCIVAGYLFLPGDAGLNLPFLPSISKTTMPSIVAVVLVLVMARNHTTHGSTLNPSLPEQSILPGWLPKYGLILILFFSLLIAEVLTALTNGDVLVYGPRVLPRLSSYDAVSRLMVTGLAVLPFLLGRKYLATPQHHRTLVFAFVIAGLIYSLPTLWEVRLSPQLNFQVYGIRFGDWSQNVRNGGFRPMVFLKHGLWLAVFLGITCIAAIAYIRMAEPRHKLKAMVASVWLLGTLVLMNSLGGLLVALVLAVPVFFFPARIQMLIAAGFAIVVLTYPIMRGAGLVPIDRALSIADSIDPQRASSLAYRLRNEDVLLEKAEQRPLFGWGSWARNQVYNQEGNDISVTDGVWVIVIGSNGWVGYLGRFGLLCAPIILLAFGRRRYPLDRATTAVVMMLTVNLLDLIPNSALNSITWLMAGALAGRLEYRLPAPDSSSLDGGESPTEPGLEKGGQLKSDHPAYSRQTAVHHRRKKETRDA